MHTMPGAGPDSSGCGLDPHVPDPGRGAASNGVAFVALAGLMSAMSMVWQGLGGVQDVVHSWCMDSGASVDILGKPRPTVISVMML